MANVQFKDALTITIRDGPDFIKANDLAALRREDLVPAKEAKVNVKRVTKVNPKSKNARKAQRDGKIDHDHIRATGAALLIDTDPRHRGETALVEAADQAHLRPVRLA